MKRFLIIFVPIAIAIISFFIYQTNYVWLVRDVKNGVKKPGGSYSYDHVYTEDGILHDYIYARNRGGEICPKTLSTSKLLANQNEIDDAMNFALSEISNGTLNSEIDLETGLTVKWKSEDKDGINSIIKVWSTGYDEPKTRTKYDNKDL